MKAIYLPHNTTDEVVTILRGNGIEVYRRNRVFTSGQASRVSGLFREAIYADELSLHSTFYHVVYVRYSVLKHKYSPLGYLFYRAGLSTPKYEESRMPAGKLEPDVVDPLLLRYGFTDIEQLEFIQDEWLQEHNIGNLVRFPQMLVSGDVW